MMVIVTWYCELLHAVTSEMREAANKMTSSVAASEVDSPIVSYAADGTLASSSS